MSHSGSGQWNGNGMNNHHQWNPNHNHQLHPQTAFSHSHPYPPGGPASGNDFHGRQYLNGPSPSFNHNQNQSFNSYSSSNAALSRGGSMNRARGRGRGAATSNPNFQFHHSNHSHSHSHSSRPHQDSTSSNRGSRGTTRGSGSRGRGRGGASSSSSFDSSLPKGVTDGKSGHLICDFQACTYRTDQSLAFTLHRADRHLIYPEGGEEELKRLDPMLIEEENEKRKKERKRLKRDDEDEEDEGTLPLIPGLNISLSTPALIEYWREERRKRWPRASVLEKKLQEEADAKDRGELKSSTSQRKDKKSTKASERGSEVKSGKRQRDEGDSDSNSSDSDSSSSDEDSDADPDGLLDESDPEIDAKLEEFASRLPPSEDEDEDGPPESISSKVPPSIKSSTAPSTSNPNDRRPLCSFFLKGSCSFGDTCRKRHERPDSTNSKSTSDGKSTIRLRPHPRPQPRNPFEAPQLELALLRAEISQHVSAVAQCVRFLVKNNWLEGVALEIEAGEDNEGNQDETKGKLIEVVNESSNTELTEDSEVSSPVIPGGSSSIPSSETPGARSLVSSTSVPQTRKKISSLEFPPEPSALIYLDPLRRDEPKPLRRIQFEALATDPSLRRLLSGFGISSDLDPLMTSISLKRALKGLDSLPTDDHRISALELILGVSTQSSINPHNDFNNSSYSNHLKQKNQIAGIEPPGSGRKKKIITEKEILSLGLRIGPDEARAIRSLAARVSEVALIPFMGNPEDATKNLGLGHLGQALALAGGAPHFDAQGWGAVMREREKEEEKLNVWKQLGLKLD